MIPTFEVTDTTMRATAGELQRALARAGKAINRHANVDALKCVRVYSASGAVVIEAQSALEQCGAYHGCGRRGRRSVRRSRGLQAICGCAEGCGEA